MEKEKIKLNGFAVIGFILGILSALGLYEFFAITPILALIFSIIALCRIKKYNSKGKVIAIIQTDYFKDFYDFNESQISVEVNKEDERKKQQYCIGGTQQYCSTGYFCNKGSTYVCAVGNSNWRCVHGYYNTHIVYNYCVHGLTISHSNYCPHGLTISHIYTEKCIHGYEHPHYYN